jgi:AraC family transcriptional regulator
MTTPRAVVEAKLESKLGRIEVRRYDFTAPVDDVLVAGGAHILDLCLTPRPRQARGRYLERWNPERFEPFGEIFFLPAGHAVHGRSECGRQSSIMCQLRAGQMRDWLEDSAGWTERRLEASFDVSSFALRTLLVRLADEARAPGFATKVLVDLIAGQLAVELARYFQAVTETPSPRGLAPWQLRAIDARLRDSPEAPSLDELATLCRLSTRHLGRAFRASRGVSVGRYVAQVRLGQAKRLLANNGSIKEVAFQLGFSSPAAFAAAFRKATGCTASAFRRAHEE